MTEGIGLVPGSAPWPDWLVKMMHSTYPGAKIRLVNGARGATQSDYMSLCLQVSKTTLNPKPQTLTPNPRPPSPTTYRSAYRSAQGHGCLARNAWLTHLMTIPVPHALYHMHGTTCVGTTCVVRLYHMHLPHALCHMHGTTCLDAPCLAPHACGTTRATLLIVPRRHSSHSTRNALMHSCSHALTPPNLHDQLLFTSSPPPPPSAVSCRSMRRWIQILCLWR